MTINHFIHFISACNFRSITFFNFSHLVILQIILKLSRDEENLLFSALVLQCEECVFFLQEYAMIKNMENYSTQVFLYNEKPQE